MVLTFVFLFFFSLNTYPNVLGDLKKLNKGMHSDPKQTLIDKGIDLIEKIEESEIKDEMIDEVDEQIELFETLKAEYAKNTYSSKFSVYGGYITWNFPLKLEREDQQDLTLFSEEKGPCIGIGHQYVSGYHGLENRLCYAFLDATIGHDGSTVIEFNQNDVTVDAFFLENNYIYKLKNNIIFKIGIPLVYRKGKYGDVDNASVKESAQIFTGYLLGSQWDYSYHSISVNVGGIDTFQSSFWAVNFIIPLF